MLLFYVQATVLPVTLVVFEKSSAHSKLYTDNKRDPGLGVDALRKRGGRGASHSLTYPRKEKTSHLRQEATVVCNQASKDPLEVDLVVLALKGGRA